MILDKEEQRKYLLDVINAFPLQGNFGQLEQIVQESPLAQLKEAIKKAIIAVEKTEVKDNGI